MNTAYYTFEGIQIIKGIWKPVTLENGNSYSYGDFQEYRGEVTEALKKSLFIIPKWFIGSDHSGGALEKSNHRSFLRIFGKVNGVYELYGGFNTYAIAIRVDVAESNPEIKSTLEELENYPLVDEEDHSELEFEWQCEAMLNILDDIIRAIDLEEYIPDIETILEDKEALEHIAWDGSNTLNLEWISETTSSFLKGTNALQSYIEDRLLIDHCKDLPLLINRNWSCNEIKEAFMNKLQQQEMING